MRDTDRGEGKQTMGYLITIHYPYSGNDYASVDTLAEAKRIVRAEKKRNPSITATIERI